MPQVSGKALWTVYACICMDTLNFGIVFPLLPSIASTFGANATQVGSLATTYALAQFCCAPLLGRLSDRFGRRPVLLVAIAGSTLSGVLTGWASTFTWLLVARAINGMCGGTGGVANAYVADVTSADEKPIYMSYISGANSLGLILGPALGGLLIRGGFSEACYASAMISGCNFLLCARFMVESKWLGAREVARVDAQTREHTNGATSGQPAHESASNGNAAQQAPVAVPHAAYYIFGANFLFVFAFAAFETVTGYYLMDTFFNGDEVRGGQVYGFIFVVVGIVMFLMSSFVYKPLFKRLGERPMIIIGVSIRSVGFLLMTFASTWELFLLATMVQLIGSTLIFPTLSSILTTMCSKEIYGRTLGYNDSVGALARVLGPPIFGRVYDHVNHQFSFYTCAVFGWLAGLLIMRAMSFNRARAPTEMDLNESLQTFERQHTPNQEVG